MLSSATRAGGSGSTRGGKSREIPMPGFQSSPAEKRQEHDSEKGAESRTNPTELKNNGTLSGGGVDKKPAVEKVVVLSFSALQLERISALQDQILRVQLERSSEVQELRPSETGKQEGSGGAGDLDDLLNRYATSLRNYDTLSQNALSSLPQESHFVGSAGALNYALSLHQGYKYGSLSRKIADADSTGILNRILKSWRRHWGAPGLVSKMESEFDEQEKMKKLFNTFGFREVDKQGREIRERHEARSLRLTMALFGGVALIAPMLIMSLYQSLKVALITTSVATVLFGIIIGFGAKDSSGKDVLGATAAYAAVLVVFVGTSLST